MSRVLYILAAALIAASSLVSQASAQALTEDDITYETECGAPGIGKKYVVRDNVHIEVILAQAGVAGINVNEEGYWSICKMPVPYADCPAMTPPVWYVRYVSKYFPDRIVRSPTCTAQGNSIRAGDVGDTRRLIGGHSYMHSDGTKRFASGTGYVTYQCQAKPDGTKGWVLVDSACR